MQKSVLLFAFALLASPALADVTFTYENFRRHENGNLEIVLKFNNQTDKAVSFVRAECALLDKSGRAITTERVLAQNIPARQHAYGRNFVLRPGAAEKADCRITRIDD